jgi:hypothetical protein
MNKREKLVRRIRTLIAAFMVGLVLSGLTAFPLPQELEILARILGASPNATPAEYTGLTHWIVTVRNALRETGAKFPFLAYGYDWLDFAHLVIAALFSGPLHEPVRNKWILDWGLIACAAIIPLALICGPLRGIPFGWRLIDCSFGIVGAIPLLLCRKYVGELEELESEQDEK